MDSDETRALVRAMESRVEYVRLFEVVTIDIRILMEYSGQEKCREVECEDDAATRYREYLRAWATSRNWSLTTYEEDENYFVIYRI